jgi:hypothetical protein
MDSGFVIPPMPFLNLNIEMALKEEKNLIWPPIKLHTLRIL